MGQSILPARQCFIGAQILHFCCPVSAAQFLLPSFCCPVSRDKAKESHDLLKLRRLILLKHNLQDPKDVSHKKIVF